MAKAVILMSGGVDSLCCAHFMKKQGFSTEAIFVDYGQAAIISEELSAKKTADYLDINLAKIKFSSPNNYSVGELSGRNLFLYASAFFGGSLRSGVICSGIHSGTRYFDCSSEFLDAVSTLLSAMSGGKIEAFAPFLSWDKVEVYKYALDNNLPLRLTHSCESSKLTPCGECISCLDRRMLQSLQKGAS